MSTTAAPAPLTRRELEAKIARRAWQDEAFRADFVADPRAAFMKYAGIPADRLPAITVHEEAPGSWHIVLPAKPAAAELSEAELEKIAGGTDVLTVTMVTAVVLTGVGLTLIGSAASAASAAAVTLGDDGW